MTIKIAKFFSGATGMPPPLPPPNAILKPNNKLSSPPYNPYMDDEDDNMSLYSTSASVITTRDHPFNNSQRPLLADKKHSAQLMPRKKQQQQTQTITKQTAAYYYQQQRQQSQYISPFVQQQKRDTAKGLHGFNDFDILSQQYNEHLGSPHIGYPYGSPPSPTVASCDFVFDGDSDSRSSNAVATSAVQLQQRQHKTPQRYGNVPNCMPAASTPSARYSHEQLDYYSSSGAQSFIGKSSRFEDDFCCRRNVEFAKDGLQSTAVAAAAASSSSCSSVSSGPFIFGLPHEQQRDGLAASRLPAPGRDFVGECLVEPALSSDSGVSVAGDSGPSLMQSSSDTSSTSHDSSSNNRSAGGGGEGGISKLLLRRSKAKKKKNNSSVVAKANLGKTTKQQTIKCVVVGDGAVGKTNLILSYLENRFNPEHVPTASDIYNGDVMVNDSPVHFTLCDTAGQDTLDPLRELCYPDSDVFLLCFSVARPETFHAIKTKWAPKFARTRAALILVGTQADLRSDSKVLNKLQTTGEKPISYADAWDLATTIGAKYIETSSATQDKVKEVFDTAIWEGLRPTTLPPTPSLWKKLFCLA